MRYSAVALLPMALAIPVPGILNSILGLRDAQEGHGPGPMMHGIPMESGMSYMPDPTGDYPGVARPTGDHEHRPHPERTGAYSGFAKETGGFHHKGPKGTGIEHGHAMPTGGFEHPKGKEPCTKTDGGMPGNHGTGISGPRPTGTRGYPHPVPMEDGAAPTPTIMARQDDSDPSESVTSSHHREKPTGTRTGMGYAHPTGHREGKGEPGRPFERPEIVTITGERYALFKLGPATGTEDPKTWMPEEGGWHHSGHMKPTATPVAAPVAE